LYAMTEFSSETYDGFTGLVNRLAMTFAAWGYFRLAIVTERGGSALECGEHEAMELVTGKPFGYRLNYGYIHGKGGGFPGIKSQGKIQAATCPWDICKCIVMGCLPGNLTSNR